MDQFRIAELAERTGFSCPTLRFYEEIGLLAPQHSDAGYRIYDGREEERLRFIGRAKRLGLSLEEIGSLVAVWAGGECAVTRRQLRELVEAKIEAVRVQVEESATFLRQLEAVHDRLDELLTSGQSGTGCECAPELPHVGTVRIDRHVLVPEMTAFGGRTAEPPNDVASAATNRGNQPRGQAMTTHTTEDLTGPASGCGCGCGAPTTVLERPAGLETTSTSSCGCGCAAADADQLCECGCDCCA